MTPKSPMSRLSTVYDLGSLRLHPDGTRVAQSSKNLRPRTSASTVRDARGNWIAKDAAGLTKVAKYVHKKGEEISEAEDGEDFDLAVVDNKEETDEEDYEVSPARKGQKKRNPKTSKDSRGAKRRKFVHDVEFLGATAAQATEDTSILPLPSSDLLKCIHHFTSTYYTERGQLFNASKQYRREKRQRKIARHAAKESKSGSKLKKAESVDAANDEENDSSTDGSGSSSDSEPSSSDSDEGGEARAEQMGNESKEKKPPDVVRKDMYKLMNGSALMAIGMLLQEHVAQLLVGHGVPEGWEDAMREQEEERSRDKDTVADTGRDVESEDEDELGPDVDTVVRGTEKISEPRAEREIRHDEDENGDEGDESSSDDYSPN